MRYAGPLLTHVHIADSFDHRASSGLRYIVNPPGSPARVHQHLDIGQGEVDWDVFFRTLAEAGFDGIATVCVFAWEERARESSRAQPRASTGPTAAEARSWLVASASPSSGSAGWAGCTRRRTCGCPITSRS